MNEGEAEKSQANVVPWPDASPGRIQSTLPAPAIRQPVPQAAGPVVSFDRRELQIILNVYGRKVAEGEWRDYAIDFTAARAVFSIFRRTAEVPLFRVEKDPKLARKQGAYSVVATGGLILRRGNDLEQVVDILNRKTRLVII